MKRMLPQTETAATATVPRWPIQNRLTSVSSVTVDVEMLTGQASCAMRRYPPAAGRAASSTTAETSAVPGPRMTITVSQEAVETLGRSSTSVEWSGDARRSGRGPGQGDPLDKGSL